MSDPDDRLEADTVVCSRCGEERESLSTAPLPGDVGDEILARVCASCWKEWERAEIMVINELQLNFMDPRSQEKLTRHMREFLGLDGAGDERDGESSELPIPPDARLSE